MKLFIRKFSRGVTLIELIVATLIAAIVLASLASVDFSIRMMSRDLAPRSMLSVEATAILNNIARTAQTATGDAVQDPKPPTFEGIYIGAAGKWLSIRQDRNGTPGNYIDDRWAMYYYQAAPLFQIVYAPNCAQRAVPQMPIMRLGTGHIKNISFSREQSADPDDLKNQLTVTLEACLDPATCPTADDPLFTASTVISLPGCGQAF